MTAKAEDYANGDRLTVAVAMGDRLRFLGARANVSRQGVLDAHGDPVGREGLVQNCQLQRPR